MRGFVVIALLITCAFGAYAQQTSSQAKAETVAAAFTKNKHAVKEKYGIRKEKYKDVRSVPAVKNVAEYSGVYEVPDLGYVINLQVGSGGNIQANGHEKEQRTFRFENARIDGALLTGTKVYQDGAKERFEGVFLNRTDRESPTEAGVTIFGLGVMLNTPFEINGLTYDKLFYVLKP